MSVSAHSFFVLKLVYVKVSSNIWRVSFPRSVVAEYQGACQNAEGDWKGSKPSLLPNQPNSASCLRVCKEDLDATGCTYNTLSGGCFSHSGEVAKGNWNNKIKCWRLSAL